MIKEEIKAALVGIFDKNGNNKIDPPEIRAAFMSMENGKQTTRNTQIYSWLSNLGNIIFLLVFYALRVNQ